MVPEQIIKCRGFLVFANESLNSKNYYTLSVDKFLSWSLHVSMELDYQLETVAGKVKHKC